MTSDESVQMCRDAGASVDRGFRGKTGARSEIAPRYEQRRRLRFDAYFRIETLDRRSDAFLSVTDHRPDDQRWPYGTR